MYDDDVYPKPEIVEAGKAAFRKGIVANPYPQNTSWNREWQRGWNSEFIRSKSGIRATYV